MTSAANTSGALPASVDSMLELLTSRGYLAERSLATVTYLSLRMGRPLFLEGEAGVGKTEIAKVLSGGPWAEADPPAMLRRPRRLFGSLRVE
ncbi:MoxR-like ATPase [Bradyrhizobium sp. F1.13.4]